MNLYAPHPLHELASKIRPLYPAHFAHFTDQTTSLSLLHLPITRSGYSGVVIRAQFHQAGESIEVRKAPISEFLEGVEYQLKFGHLPMTAYFGRPLAMVDELLGDKAQPVFSLNDEKVKVQSVGPAIISGLAENPLIKAVFEALHSHKNTQHVDRLVHQLEEIGSIRTALRRAVGQDQVDHYQTWGSFA